MRSILPDLLLWCSIGMFSFVSELKYSAVGHAHCAPLLTTEITSGSRFFLKGIGTGSVKPLRVCVVIQKW